jgi:hypothetical protein
MLSRIHRFPDYLQLTIRLRWLLGLGFALVLRADFEVYGSEHEIGRQLTAEFMEFVCRYIRVR